MTKETRGNIAVISAIAMLSFGMIFTGIGFFVAPLGEVSDSVLWILGQALIYAGGIFGVAAYTKNMVDLLVECAAAGTVGVKGQLVLLTGLGAE